MQPGRLSQAQTAQTHNKNFRRLTHMEMVEGKRGRSKEERRVIVNYYGSR